MTSFDEFICLLRQFPPFAAEKKLASEPIKLLGSHEIATSRPLRHADDVEISSCVEEQGLLREEIPRWLVRVNQLAS